MDSKKRKLIESLTVEHKMKQQRLGINEHFLLLNISVVNKFKKTVRLDT
jgi:hypothetical protein